jgi:hypothetical protein
MNGTELAVNKKIRMVTIVNERSMRRSSADPHLGAEPFVCAVTDCQPLHGAHHENDTCSDIRASEPSKMKELEDGKQ